MPVNITVSHVSPLLDYIPRSAWYEFTLENDSELPWSANATCHATNATVSGSASVTFSWQGTGIARCTRSLPSHRVYGSYQSWLGPYQVILDGVTTDFDGFTGGQEQLDYPLFSTSDLPLGQHEVRIVNTGSDSTRPVLGIDYFVFESQLEVSRTIEHNDTDCVWEPKTPNAWQVTEASHTTYLDSGKMGFNFTVRAGIAIYGELDPTSSPFSITIDGHTDAPYSPNIIGGGTTEPTNQLNQSTLVLIYCNTNLIQGDHTLLLENNPDSDSATKLSISHGTIYSEEDASLAP
ncbi:hypothetical protein BD414DRAFT_423340 [Trametes punicea]|nr:hypothetical protein BD414DRAFT_423340 [Trametes punicea]